MQLDLNRFDRSCRDNVASSFPFGVCLSDGSLGGCLRANWHFELQIQDTLFRIHKSQAPKWIVIILFVVESSVEQENLQDLLSQ
jgi:hypothetical protein